MATCAGRCRAHPHLYGSPRTAELKWKGTLIGASEGTQVKAVAPGQVVYADWLDGFGMLLVIDHGKELHEPLRPQPVAAAPGGTKGGAG